MSYDADGVHYPADPPSVFANAPKVVPGEVSCGCLLVRNAHPRAVDIFVQPPLPESASEIMPEPAHSGRPSQAVGNLPDMVCAWLPRNAGNAPDQTSDILGVSTHASDEVPAADVTVKPAGQLGGRRVGLVDSWYAGGILPLGLSAHVVDFTLYGTSRCRTCKVRKMEGELG